MSRRVYVYDKASGEMVEVKRAPRRRNATCWPIYSDTTGVNPDQIPYAQEKLLRDHGVFTEFCPHTGRAILRDKAHKVAHYRATGTADADAGYGDAVPLHVTSDMRRARGM